MIFPENAHQKGGYTGQYHSGLKEPYKKWERDKKFHNLRIWIGKSKRLIQCLPFKKMMTQSVGRIKRPKENF